MGIARGLILPLALVVALVAVGSVRADDIEDPIHPAIAVSGPIDVGDKSIALVGVGGDAVDAWETLEPQVTVYMTSGSADLSPSEHLVITAQPVVDISVAQ